MVRQWSFITRRFLRTNQRGKDVFWGVRGVLPQRKFILQIGTKKVSVGQGTIATPPSFDWKKINPPLLVEKTFFHPTPSNKQPLTKGPTINDWERRKNRKWIYFFLAKAFLNFFFLGDAFRMLSQLKNNVRRVAEKNCSRKSTPCSRPMINGWPLIRVCLQLKPHTAVDQLLFWSWARNMIIWQY